MKVGLVEASLLQVEEEEAEVDEKGHDKFAKIWDRMVPDFTVSRRAN
jgi:hypothetical protein